MSLASRSSRRHHRALQHRAIALVVLSFVLVACVVHNGASNGSPSSIPSVLEPGDVVAPSPSPVASEQTIPLARTKSTPIVFVIWEDRTFDTLFGRFPAADGGTQVPTCDGEAAPPLAPPPRV